LEQWQRPNSSENEIAIQRRQAWLEQAPADSLQGQVGKVFYLDEIVETHLCLEENKSGAKIELSHRPVVVVRTTAAINPEALHSAMLL